MSSFRHSKPPTSSYVALSTLLVALAVSFSASADATFDGKWRQSALREDFTVQRWQEGCGPPPKSSSSGGGETIQVKAEGDVLAFLGGGRVFRSNQCYDPLPSLARESYSHAADSRQWRTRCTTPPGDPRKTIMQTLVVATSDSRIEVTETGRYEIAHEGGLCVADVRRSRSFDLISRDNPTAPASASASAPPKTVEPPPPPPPREEPKPASSCASPGPAARLEVRPSKKLVRTGEKFLFRAKVVDKDGCPATGDVKWVAGKEATVAGVVLDAKGEVSVPASAPEGTYELEASAEGKTARVTLEVSSAANYDALLGKEGLNSAGETDTASVTMLPGVSIGSSEVVADDGRKKRRTIFVSLVGLAVVALGAAYLILRKRQKRAQELEQETLQRHEDRLKDASLQQEAQDADYRQKLVAHEESVRAAEEAKRKLEEARAARAAAKAGGAAAVQAPTEERSCPTCRRTFVDTSFCPHDGSKLVAKAADELGASPTCPRCKRAFPEGTKVCPEHGEELVSMPPTGRAAPQKAARAKICPSCGARFEGAATFCGKDGTSLVLLN